MSVEISNDAHARRALISRAYDPQLLRAAGDRLVRLLSDHLHIVQQGEGPVLNWHEPQKNIAAARKSLADSNLSVDLVSPPELAPLLERFEELIQQSLARGQNLHHPHYVGHQVPASVPLAAWFDAVTTLTNQVMAIYEMGPWATAVEHAVVEQLGEAIGFEPGSFGGLVTSGGSLANLTALLTARNVALGESWSHGLADHSPAPVLLAHAEAHYCVMRSAGILGIGTDQVLRIPLDPQRRIDVNRLDTMLSELRAKNVPIVAVSAAACATPIGAFDPLVDIAEVCRRHEVWLHVDAAHGGAASLSSKYRHLVEGLHLADSVVCDAHKMLFMPALCALVFYSDRQHRFATFEQVAPYLFDPSAPGMAEFDSGVCNLECTKRAAAMGLWGIWSLFGSQLFEALVDETFDKGLEFYELLNQQPDFKPFCQPQCNIVVFRYEPTQLETLSEAEADDFQLRLRRKVVESGDYYLVPIQIDGRNYLRTTIINPLTTVEHLGGLLDCLRHHGKALLSSSHS